jgi:acyl carrier protein
MNIDFIKLLNAIADVARPAHYEKTNIKDENEKFNVSGLDSLDCLLIGIYMCDLYGIPEDIAKQMQVTTPLEMLQFINKHKTRQPESIEKAVESVK